jgi:hypothetical protein
MVHVPNMFFVVTDCLPVYEVHCVEPLIFISSENRVSLKEGGRS